MRIRPDVLFAIQNKLPVVALESTIISHGMPYPKNVETALLVEEEIIKNHATPATTGLVMNNQRKFILPRLELLMARLLLV